MSRRRLFSFILAASAFALLIAGCGPNKEMGFQGYLMNSSGSPINGQRDVEFRFFQNPDDCSNGGDASPEPPILTEAHANVPIVNGLLNVQIGTGTTHEGLDGMDPAVFAQPLWLEIVVDGEALEPCQKVMGAPYAMSLAGGAVVGSNHEGNGPGDNDDTTVDYGSLSVLASSDAGTALVIGSNGGDLIRACYGIFGARTCSELRFRVASDGEVYAVGAFHGGGADFAEMIQAQPAARDYEPGDVLVISPDADRTVELADQPNSTAVVGVYSTEPGFVGRPEGDLAGGLPVAITGIVPVKVSAENGPIQRGDLLTTSSTPGYAMLSTEALPGTLLGKAMGELESGAGVIEVLLILR